MMEGTEIHTEIHVGTPFKACRMCRYIKIYPRTEYVDNRPYNVSYECRLSEICMNAVRIAEKEQRINNRITADAVPVSFIKEKIERYSGYGNELYAAGALAELVRDWKKEVMRNGEVCS